MITLYYSPQSCSLIPHIFLKELNVNYNTQLVSIKDGMHKKPEFLMLNPKGKITIIKHANKVITETIAILHYIMDIYPSSALIPKDIKKKSNVWEWVSFFSTSLHTAFIRLFRPNYFTSYKEDYKHIQQLANKDIADIFLTIDNILSNQNYLNGEDFQLCDIFLFNYGRWGNLASIPTKNYLSFAKFMTKIAQRLAVTSVMQTEDICLYRDVYPLLK